MRRFRLFMLFLCVWRHIDPHNLQINSDVSHTLTITFVNAIFLVYVVNVFLAGSHIDSSTILTDFALINRSPHFGTLFVFDNIRLVYNFPSRIDRSMVSSVRTCVLQINKKIESWSI